MLTIELEMVIIFFQTHDAFLVSILGATLNCIPLKYWCPNKKNNQIRPTKLQDEGFVVNLLKILFLLGQSDTNVASASCFHFHFLVTHNTTQTVSVSDAEK